MKNNEIPMSPLAHLLFQQPNSLCSQCGRASKQWADLSHAIFLCLNCAALYREYSWATVVKSIGLDTWSSQEVERMEKGGNQSFSNFMKFYGLDQEEIRIKITSKAAAYYRSLLDGKAVGNQPSVELGRQVCKENIPLTEMSPEQLLDAAKDKAYMIGSRTKEIGEKGIKKIQEKYQSGQLKEDAKKTVEKISIGAQWLWGAMKQKAGQIAKDFKK